MKKTMIKFAAIAGLAGAMAAPASADHDDRSYRDYRDFAVRVGPGYIIYDDDYRWYNRHRRYDREYARYMKKRWKQRQRWKRRMYARDFWHWHVGPYGDTFCAVDHSYLRHDHEYKKRKKRKKYKNRRRYYDD